MAEQSVHGRFVWHDLTTPDRQGAAAFYEKALGWKTMPWEQDPSYLMFAAASGPIGGVMESRDATPSWLPYIETSDLEAVVRDAERNGGKLLTAPTDLPNGGRYAVLADPHGASFGVYWSAKSEPGGTEAGVGEFSWHELATTDQRAAFEFYRALFGWDKVVEHDMGPMGIYTIFGRDGAQWGGIFNKGDQGKPGPAYWLGYVRVKDLDGVVERVKGGRGACLAGPMEVPGGDRIAQLQDPYGALFAAHLRAADAAQKGGVEAVPPRETEQPAASVAAKPSRAAAPAKKAAKKKAAKKKAPSKKKVSAKKSTASRKKRPARKKAAAAKRRAGAKKPARRKAAAAKRGHSKAAAGRKRAGKKKTVAKKRPAKKRAGKAAGKRRATKKAGGRRRRRAG